MVIVQEGSKYESGHSTKGLKTVTNFYPKDLHQLQEWVCEVCQKRRALVLSTGLWYPGVEPTADIPLAREIETRLEEIKSTEGRAPLGRSASLDDVDDKHSRKPIKRQSSLPCPVVSKATPDKLMLPIKESGESKESSKLSLVSPSSEELPTSSTGKSRFRDAYLSYEPTLRQRQKAYAFSKNSYVQKKTITVGENSGKSHESKIK
ncbi:hypothetical protein KUTeg_020833 [Tegillarca granosa]|uniref:Uncharacterized protein n=1 Tax=Tegillarca granosa TaxID=220873 RepID=A0ABQ9EBR3_TEGGR|nr:hypothetical protein KUTeg_020833 [Tegillarca granosa]